MYDDEQELDLTTFRYVMYLRKSTENEGRQIRSIGDQQTDCEAIPQRLGLNIVAIIKKERSAKKPNNRPDFSGMLERTERSLSAIEQRTLPKDTDPFADMSDAELEKILSVSRR